MLRFVKHIVYYIEIYRIVCYNKNMRTINVETKYIKYLKRTERKFKRYCPSVNLLVIKDKFIDKNTIYYSMYMFGKNYNNIYSLTCDSMEHLKGFIVIYLKNLKDNWEDEHNKE